MRTAVTTLALLASLCLALAIYCMVSGLCALISRLRSRLVTRRPATPPLFTPRSSFRFPTVSPAYHSTLTRSNSAVMFKKAVDTHNASSRPDRSTLKQQLFPSATFSKQQNSHTQPLSTTTTNTSKPGAEIELNRGPQLVQNGQIPPSNGLLKALTSGSASFDDENLVKLKPTPQQTGGAPSAIQSAIFDEGDLYDDFDFDVDFDFDDLSAKKSVITYPSLPAVAAKPKPSTEACPPTGGLSDPADSNHHSKAPPVAKKRPAPDEAEQQIPWAPSPPKHRHPQPQGNALRKFLYDPSDGHDDVPRPRKRRALPWDTKSKPDTSMPPTKVNKPSWDASASTIKQQRKNHRETNKRSANLHATTTAAPKSGPVRTGNNVTISSVFLSEEQKRVLRLVVNEGKSVFFTGSAGTGKSVLLREIISGLKKKYQRESGDRIAITASTGLAACNIGGVTLHSFAGIGLGTETAEELIKKIKRKSNKRSGWRNVKVLVMDEVSMIDGVLFDKLEHIARALRGNGRPFGGIQLVITGDFFQLPPVSKQDKASPFAFQANTWNTAVGHTIGLTQVFRQKDRAFADMLNEMREGRLSQQSIQTFKNLKRPLSDDSGLEATELFPRRQQVDDANQSRMRDLAGDVHEYKAMDGGSLPEGLQRKKLVESQMAPQEIHLKKGAQVMLIKNMDDTLVNGSLGRVIGFMNESMFDSYQQNEPQFYSASAASCNDGLDERAQRRRAKLADMHGAPGTGQLYPVVRFSMPDGTQRDLLCQREQWKTEEPNGQVIFSRSQLPLILAWALSIHKAQGQTLERVKVDLKGTFERGQAYVALSRATTMDGLQVMNFDERRVNAHPLVRDFYANLSKAQASSVRQTEPVQKRGGITAEEYEKMTVAGDGAGGFDDADDDDDILYGLGGV